MKLELQQVHETRRDIFLAELERETRPIIEERNRRINLAMNDAMEKYREVSKVLEKRILYPV